MYSLYNHNTNTIEATKLGNVTTLSNGNTAIKALYSALIEELKGGSIPPEGSLYVPKVKYMEDRYPSYGRFIGQKFHENKFGDIVRYSLWLS
jgi:hypothetical protein